MGSSAALELHKTRCGGRPCRPGEGNLKGYDLWKEPDGLADHWNSVSANLSKGVPHTSDPYSAQYAPLVLAASARQQRNLVIFAVADYDYRELAENWALSNKKAGNPALLYALDSEGYQYLSSRGVPVFDGTANFKEWDGYRLVRHLQRVEAEKFTAAAALAASGLDVLLTDVSHVFRAQAAGLFQANNVTALVGRTARPDRGNRLRLDRYDEIDFDAQRAKMEEEGLWLLGGS